MSKRKRGVLRSNDDDLTEEDLRLWAGRDKGYESPIERVSTGRKRTTWIDYYDEMEAA